MPPPNEFARSGFHSGETASGYFDESFSVTIAGVDRTRKCDFDALEVHETTEETPHECMLQVKGFTPAEGDEVKIYNGGVDVGVPLFAGRVIEATALATRSTERATWKVMALDQRWLLDRFARVTKTYYSQGVNTILRDIITNYTNGGFTVGYCPMTLGNIDRIEFTQVTVSEALRRLAEAVGAVALVDYTKRVSIAVTPDEEGNVLSLVDGGTDYWDVGVPGDIAEIGTRVLYEGGGSEASTLVSSGSTTLPLNNTVWYSSTGGTVRSGTNLITYTGRSVASGPGSLTGVTGIVVDIPLGQPVNVYVQADDATAQTNLATLLGGGLSGIATRYTSDGRLSVEECTLRASAELEYYKTRLNTKQYTTTNPYTRVGRNVTVNVTKPRVLNETLRIQRMTLRGRHKIDSTTSELEFDRIVTASRVRRELTAALREAGVV